MSRIPMKLTSGERMVSKCTFPVDKITFHRLVDESTVAKIDKPEEESVVHGPRQGGHRVEAVVCVLALVHPLSADLDLGTMKLP